MASFKEKIKIYDQLFSFIPKDYYERFIYLLETLKFKTNEVNKIVELYKKLTNIKYNKIKMIFYMCPEATPRPRGSFKTKRYYVKNSANNSELLHEVIDDIKVLPLIHTQCNFTVINYFPIPSGMNRFEKLFAELKLIRPVTKPDWDNLGKTYSDMIQKYLLLNDSLIVDGRSLKFYSSKPRVEIIIEYMEKYDCEFNKKKIVNSVFYANSDKEKLNEDIETILKLKGD